MIEAASYSRNIAYAERIAQRYAATAKPEERAAVQTAYERVSISSEGRAMSAAVERATNGGEKPQTLVNGQLPPLPAWAFDFHQASQRAEAGLKEAMRQLDIPADTAVSLHTESDGTITVESQSPKNAELEAMVNESFELRNSLVAAQSAAYLARLGETHDRMQAAVQANPSRASEYHAWLIGAAQRIMAMGFRFDFTAGQLNASFIANGQSIGLRENLESPPA